MPALNIINFVSKMKILWTFFVSQFSTMFRGEWQSCFRLSRPTLCDVFLFIVLWLHSADGVRCFYSYAVSSRLFFGESLVVDTLPCWSVLPHLILLFISNLTSRIRERERTKRWIYVSCDAIYCRDIYIISHLNFRNLWRNGVQAFYSSLASSISILPSFKDFFSPSLM
jgi:hypothetical protein